MALQRAFDYGLLMISLGLHLSDRYRVCAVCPVCVLVLKSTLAVSLEGFKAGKPRAQAERVMCTFIIVQLACCELRVSGQHSGNNFKLPSAVRSVPSLGRFWVPCPWKVPGLVNELGG